MLHSDITAAFVIEQETPVIDRVVHLSFNSAHVCQCTGDCNSDNDCGSGDCGCDNDCYCECQND